MNCCDSLSKQTNYLTECIKLYYLPPCLSYMDIWDDRAKRCRSILPLLRKLDRLFDAPSLPGMSCLANLHVTHFFRFSFLSLPQASSRLGVSQPRISCYCCKKNNGLKSRERKNLPRTNMIVARFRFFSDSVSVYTLSILDDFLSFRWKTEEAVVECASFVAMVGLIIHC